MIQTAEGALDEVHSMLQRMNELATQAANDTLATSDRTAIYDELDQLRQEINSNSSRTKFNGKGLLDGSLVTTNSGTGTVNNGFVVASGTNTSVASVDVSQAKAGTTYTLSNAAGVLTLSDGSGNSQAIDLTATTVAANGSLTLNFDKLGVKITVASVAGETGANVSAGLNGGTIITSAASASANIQIGSRAADALSVAFQKVDTTASSLNLDALLTAFNTALSGTNSAQVTAAQNLMTGVQSAIQTVSTVRGNLGAYQNRLEHTIASLGVASSNLSASESRIRDADVAEETVTFTKAGILQQAGTAILAQANQSSQNVLSLLRG
jgi:flagellin